MIGYLENPRRRASRRTVRRSRSTVQGISGPWFSTLTTSPQGCPGRSSCPRTRSSQVASRRARILRMAAGSPARRPGLPPTRPRLRAASRPALVRSAISARSKVGDRARHLQREHPLQGRGVDRIVQATKIRPFRRQLLDHREQMTDRVSDCTKRGDLPFVAHLAARNWLWAHGQTRTRSPSNRSLPKGVRNTMGLWPFSERRLAQSGRCADPLATLRPGRR
jgi:hypothetical protein